MKALPDFREMIQHCIKCGFCQAHCPTFAATGIEPNVARGRLQLVKGRLAAEETAPRPKYLEKLNQCLLCGNCAQFCPPGVEPHKIIEAARAAYVQQNGAAGPLKTAAGSIGSCGNITGDAPANRLLWVAPELLGKIPFGQKAELLYWTGCVPALYPSAYGIPQSFLKILIKSGISYSLLGADEACCGYPLAIGGLVDEARDAARENLRKIRASGASQVVTTCPSCYACLADYYPQLLGEETGLHVIHASQLVRRLIEDGKITLRDYPASVTYHDPCDLGRKSKIYDDPRWILQAIPGITLEEMAHNREDARCCGGGGNLEMHDSTLSRQVARQRVEEAQDTGAQILASTCQQCRRTLLGAAREMRARIKVKDIMEIVAEAIV